jgi:hypothetical protein
VSEEQDSPDWPGVPCEHDAWPYSSDAMTFEARRAVGQLVKTFGTGLNPPGIEEDGNEDPALRYIYAVGRLEAALTEIRKDLVAEARTREVPWEKIGKSLNTSKQGAYNRFRSGLSTARLGQLRDEARTCLVAAEVAKPRAVPQHIAGGLDGATPGDRMNYLGHQAIDIISEIRDKDLLSPDPPSCKDALEAMKASGRKIRRLGLLVTGDHAMWKAALDSSRRPEGINQANYYAPATYVLHVMRLLIIAWVSVPDDDCQDIDRYRAGLDTASRIYANLVLFLERDDVSSVVPCQCGNTWNRCDGTCVARP